MLLFLFIFLFVFFFLTFFLILILVVFLFFFLFVYNILILLIFFIVILIRILILILVCFQEFLTFLCSITLSSSPLFFAVFEFRRDDPRFTYCNLVLLSGLYLKKHAFSLTSRHPLEHFRRPKQREAKKTVFLRGGEG